MQLQPTEVQVPKERGVGLESRRQLALGLNQVRTEDGKVYRRNGRYLRKSETHANL